MAATKGLTGLRPDPRRAADLTTPPYDVIKSGSTLLDELESRADSLYHVILGPRPKASLDRLVASGALIEDREPSYYVYEQSWAGQSRTGVLTATEVSDYSERQVIRHEKTFDAKVSGRIALANETGHTIGPVFLLTKSRLGDVLDEAKKGTPLYAFESDFGPDTDLSGVMTRVWRIPEATALGTLIRRRIATEPLYIADGHHRYHAALRNEQTHLLAYVTEEARILAYNRVVNGLRSFDEVEDGLDLVPTAGFGTPPKHGFAIYSRRGCWTLAAKEVPEDVVGRLDCAILEREVYPLLGLTREQIVDPRHFDYYPETALGRMQEVVDGGEFELAIALHPVSLDELMAVADAGLEDPEIVMPEKSTFFSPKILTGLFLYRHEKK